MTGRLIKISRNGERFWCEVMGIHDDGRYQARVNNHLVNKTYEFGEIIDIKPEEVIEEWKNEFF